MSNRVIWVGIMNATGALMVYDSQMQHSESLTVYLFSTLQKRMREFPKAHIRPMITSVRDSRSAPALQAYSHWMAIHGDTFIAAEASRVEEHHLDVQREKVKLEQQRSDTIIRHQAYIASLGRTDAGITRNKLGSTRFTHCYNCKANLNSFLNLQCNACHWFVCSCGACGCGYKDL